MNPLLLSSIALYLIYGAAMVWLHPRFIYPFQPDDQVLPGFERVKLVAGDGSAVYVQEARGDGPVLLYFMGNAGALPYFSGAFDIHLSAGRHVVALEYRGGGGRPGLPSETALKDDALAAADYALSNDKPLIVQGFSLGTGLATFVASRRDVAGAVLTAPYDRLCYLMSVRSALPACRLPGVQRWDSFRDAQSVDAPMLVLHGSDDRQIPSRRSEAFEQLPNVRRVLIEGAAHNDIGAFRGFDKELHAFIHSLDL